MSAELSQVAAPSAPARSWKPYPAYKDSGVEWLRKVPEHWEVTRIKYTSNGLYKSFVDGDWIEAEFITKDGIRLIQTGNIGIGIYKEQGFKYISEATFKELKCTEILPNDVLICRLAYPVGRACLVPDLGTKMITSVDNCILKLSKYFDSSFMIYSLSSTYYLDYLETISRGGTRQRISRTMLGDLSILFPPLSEQRAIARYLDDRTRKIASLIEKKQKQIELLKEERAAIINQAVTKGLDPRAPMRDSGVEWLGKVPKKWEVKRLKYLVTLVNEKSNSDSLDVKIALENIESYTGKLINLDSETIFEGEAKAFMKGDVLFNKLRPYLAKVYNAKTNGVCVGELLVFRPSKSLISDFLYYRVLSEDFIKEVNSSTYGAKMPRASWEFIGNMLIPFPAIEEQREIIKFIESEYAGIDQVVSKIEKEISLLQEYRTALISEVVTGKIDVREAI